jgi:hypothetical protein
MTIYTQHPAGYPQTVMATQGRAGAWWVTADTWHTPTSHEGPRRVSGPYRTRSAAVAAIQDDDQEGQ